MDFKSQAAFKKRTVEMSIAEDLILSSKDYKELVSSGKDSTEAILECLSRLGGKTSYVERVKGIIRCSGDKQTGYYGALYNLSTTKDCPFKYKYESIVCLSPENIPDGKEKVLIEDLGKDYEHNSEHSNKPE